MPALPYNVAPAPTIAGGGGGGGFGGAGRAPPRPVARRAPRGGGPGWGAVGPRGALGGGQRSSRRPAGPDRDSLRARTHVVAARWRACMASGAFLVMDLSVHGPTQLCMSQANHGRCSAAVGVDSAIRSVGADAAWSLE